MKVEIELPEIEGYEYTGEYRGVEEGEYFLPYTRMVAEKYEYSAHGIFGNALILRPKRWRAEEGGEYYSFTDDLKIADCIDDYNEFDYSLYKSGNYFQTKEQCQQAIDKIKEVLKG